MTTAEWAILGYLVAPFLLLGLLALIARLRRPRPVPRTKQGEVYVVDFQDRWVKRLG
jgi:hypothetical protein